LENQRPATTVSFFCQARHNWAHPWPHRPVDERGKAMASRSPSTGMAALRRAIMPERKYIHKQ
jgi:hypothetical protein